MSPSSEAHLGLGMGTWDPSPGPWGLPRPRLTPCPGVAGLPVMEGGALPMEKVEQVWETPEKWKWGLGQGRC